MHAKPKNPANLLYFGGSVLAAGFSTPDTYPRILVNFSEPFGTQEWFSKQWLHACHSMNKKIIVKKTIFPQKNAIFLKKLKIFKIPEQIPVWRRGKLTLGVRYQFLSYRAVVGYCHGMC